MYPEEKYFVGSISGGTPERIFFNITDAFASGFEYLDSFDEQGYSVGSYELKEDGYERSC